MKNQSNPEHWNGSKNKAIRYYFYAKRGLELLNEFRYLLMAIFAIYYALEVKNIILIPIMFCVSVPVLMVLGWINTHHMKKVMEYLNIEFSTYWSRYAYELQEKQLKQLEEIREELARVKSGK